MTNQIDTIIDKTTAVVDFWGKTFYIKRLKLGTVLKIADMFSSVSLNMYELQKKLLEEKQQMNDISLILKSIKQEDLYELLCIILKNKIDINQDDIAEIEELFNFGDLVKLVNILIEFEDIQSLFLGVRTAIVKATQAKAEQIQ